WLSTEPSEYAVSSRVAASSTASEIAIPSEPGESGCSASTLRPAWVSSDGEATHSAPQVAMSERRNGFCSYETLTMYTLHSSPTTGEGSGSAEPPGPARVSVASRLRPSSRL